MTDNISEPAREWEYRNFLCRLYRLGGIKLLGYVRVGDEWTQVLETENFLDDKESKVENEVDRIIRKAIRDEADKIDFPFDDPVDPNPGINPNPNPNPLPPDDDPWPPGPYYGPPEYDHTYIPNIQLGNQSGTATVAILSQDPEKLAETMVSDLVDSINTTNEEEQPITFR